MDYRLLDGADEVVHHRLGIVGCEVRLDVVLHRVPNVRDLAHRVNDVTAGPLLAVLDERELLFLFKLTCNFLFSTKRCILYTME